MKELVVERQIEKMTNSMKKKPRRRRKKKRMRNLRSKLEEKISDLGVIEGKRAEGILKQRMKLKTLGQLIWLL